ncbi:MAG: FAD-dependent 5-carboxymethylaminomethyl-2-thiouridine(34) oxidoreductase MnmC [Phenylobacterium sp.]
MSSDAPSDSALAWSEDGQPRSRLYGDLYFSAQDGLAESRAVFLEGCGLPDAWAGRRRFVVGELGFGTGLNILALLDLWRRARPPNGQLHIFSVEAHPVTAADAARALAHWPELSQVAEPLLARWPGQARGLHRVDLPEFAAILDVAVMQVEPALAGWSGRADAWFLDGFAPAVNPAMWRDEVLALTAQRSAPGARAATFTVAGQVRRGLAAAGFEVEKRPGFGRKRERLEARLPGLATEPPAPRKVAIVGAGIAGAAASWAIRALGGEAVLVEAEAPGAGGSGNPAALVTPRLDAGLGPPAELFAQAFRRATALYDDLPDAVISRGVLQLATQPRDADRFAKIAASDLFEPATMKATDEGLALRAALVVEPAAVLRAWAAETVKGDVHALRREEGGWVLLDKDERVVVRADAVIVAAAMDSANLCAGLPLKPFRGQASFVRGLADPPGALAWGGYAVPTRDGLLFGATYDRDDTETDVRAADHARNLATVAQVRPELAEQLAACALQGRASIRATTPDRAPIAGPAPDGDPGLYVLTGFGSRGFSLAPLLAEHVAALAMGAPSPLPAPLAELVDPERFRRRAARRGS